MGLLRQRGPPLVLALPVGVGLDAGEAVPVESGFRGGALNLAARLCSEAGSGEILGSQSLVHLARAVEGVRYLDRGEQHFKGLSDPVRVLAIASEDGDVAGQIRVAPAHPIGASRCMAGGCSSAFSGHSRWMREAARSPSAGRSSGRCSRISSIRANQLVPADTLVDEIWGDEPPDKARNILQTYVSHLRKALGHDRIQSPPPATA